jgi:hypothetical protein
MNDSVKLFIVLNIFLFDLTASIVINNAVSDYKGSVHNVLGEARAAEAFTSRVGEPDAGNLISDLSIKNKKKALSEIPLHLRPSADDVKRHKEIEARERSEKLKPKSRGVAVDQTQVRKTPTGSMVVTVEDRRDVKEVHMKGKELSEIPPHMLPHANDIKRHKEIEVRERAEKLKPKSRGVAVDQAQVRKTPTSSMVVTVEDRRDVKEVHMKGKELSEIPPHMLPHANDIKRHKEIEVRERAEKSKRKK